MQNKEALGKKKPVVYAGRLCCEALWGICSWENLPGELYLRRGNWRD